MKTWHRELWIIVLGIIGGNGALAAPREFRVDPLHSGVAFRIRHLYTIFTGRFNVYSGVVTCDPKDLSTLEMRGEVDLASIDTGNEDRDKHLRGPDFFDVARFPTATLKSTRAVPGKDGAVTLYGQLGFRGITAEVTFKCKSMGYGIDHRKGRRIGLHCDGALDRTTFGMSYNQVLKNGVSVLGKNVEIVLDIEAVEGVDGPGPKSLAKRIEKFRAGHGKVLPNEVKAALAKAGEAIAKQGDISGLKVGDKAPDFALPDAYGKILKLSDALAKGPVVLVFFRGEWCPFCNLQLRALEDSYQEIRKARATLIAVSPQKPEKSITQKKGAGLTFPLLSDASGETTRAYKLLYHVPDAMKKIYRERFGIDLAEYNGEGRWELPVTATYIIDRKGTISAAVVDLDYTKRMEPADIVATLKKLR